MVKLRQWLARSHRNVWHGWAGRAYHKGRYQLRLSVVQAHLTECLEVAPAGPLRIVSVCAGDGRDVIGVLRSHPRRTEVTAWLVELDRVSVTAGIQLTTSEGLGKSVNFLHKDATAFETYLQIAPSDILLVCGVWGHVPVDERSQLVYALSCFCRPGGTVIWTCGAKKGGNRVQAIQSLFTGSSWECVRLSSTPDQRWAVATHRYCGPPNALPRSGPIFNFQRNAGNDAT